MSHNKHSWRYARPGPNHVADEWVQRETWGSSFPTCINGIEQSPINIVTGEAIPMKSLPEISTDIDAAPHYVSNTGSGFQLFETTPTESMIANGTFIDTIEGSSKGESWVGGQKFLFYQMHWHTPSENTIDGRSFPLEAHFVHQLDDPMLVGTLHRLAVISLLYEPGPCNAFLDQFWEEFPMVDPHPSGSTAPDESAPCTNHQPSGARLPAALCRRSQRL